MITTENQHGQQSKPGNQNQGNQNISGEQQRGRGQSEKQPPAEKEKEQTGGKKEHKDTEHPHEHKTPVFEPDVNNSGQKTERETPVAENPDDIRGKKPLVDPTKPGVPNNKPQTL